MYYKIYISYLYKLQYKNIVEILIILHTYIKENHIKFFETSCSTITTIFSVNFRRKILSVYT